MAQQETRRYVTIAFMIYCSLAVLVQGCASVPEGPPEMKQRALSFSPSPGTSYVYIIRPYNVVGSAVDYKISMDGNEFGKLGLNSYLLGTVLPGRHYCNSVPPMGTCVFNAEAGKSYFFHLSPLGKITSISPEEGERDVRNFVLSGDCQYDMEHAIALIKVDIPPASIRTGFFGEVALPDTLQILNIQTSKVTSWGVSRGGQVRAYLSAGKYIVSGYKRQKENGTATETVTYPMRYEIDVPSSEDIIYYGIISIQLQEGSGYQIMIHPAKDTFDEVRKFGGISRRDDVKTGPIIPLRD